ncbi:MAG: hypothetical protein IJ325_01245 [Clostridia bacterium]|nr:hypothetical protein [Clostridia bacterium]
MKYRMMMLLLTALIVVSSCENAPVNATTIEVLIEDQKISIDVDSLHEWESFRSARSSTNTIQVVPTEDFENRIDYNEIIIFKENAILLNEYIYIPVLCCGLYDEYVYDPTTEVGYYMSGVQSLCKEKNDQIALARKHEHIYYLNKLISINEDLSAAVVRRSNKDNYSAGNYLAGEYYVLDFETGEFEYICDSYPHYSDTIPGTRIEGIEWNDDEEVKISTYNSDDELCIYAANKNDRTWKITCVS